MKKDFDFWIFYFVGLISAVLLIKLFKLIIPLLIQ